MRKMILVAVAAVGLAACGTGKAQQVGTGATVPASSSPTVTSIALASDRVTAAERRGRVWLDPLPADVSPKLDPQGVRAAILASSPALADQLAAPDVFAHFGSLRLDDDNAQVVARTMQPRLSGTAGQVFALWEVVLPSGMYNFGGPGSVEGQASAGGGGPTPAEITILVDDATGKVLTLMAYGRHCSSGCS